MKIDYAIMSCDMNPFYMDFIPVVSEAWKRIGIMPVYAIVGDRSGRQLSKREIIHYVPEVEGVKTSFTAQNARIWLWKELQGNCILSDVDMMPLSGEYFNGTAEKYQEHEIISYCNDAEEKFGQIAACYILARTNIMRGLILENTYEEFIKARAEETGQGWGGDQWYLGELLKKYSAVVRLKRGFNSGGEAFNRLDRVNWHIDPSKVAAGYYYDAHLPRPYAKHKEEIDNLLTMLP